MKFLTENNMCNNYLKYNTHKDVMKAVKDVDADYLLLINSLNSFNSTNETINKEGLLSFPIFKWVSLNNKVKIRRRKNLFHHLLNFDTILEEGGKFGNHFHRDMVESAEVIVGEILDKTDGKIYKRGDVMHYDIGQSHQPVALEYTELKVLFK